MYFKINELLHYDDATSAEGTRNAVNCACRFPIHTLVDCQHYLSGGIVLDPSPNVKKHVQIVGVFVQLS